MLKALFRGRVMQRIVRIVLNAKFIALAILVILVGTALYEYVYHSTDKHSHVEGDIDTSISDGEAVNITLRINYSIIVDPLMLSKAREFMKTQLPLPASLGDVSSIDWLRSRIAILKVVVELVNNDNKTIYYVTNAWCGVTFNSTMQEMFNPIAWRVENPITIPSIVASKGHVFPLTIIQTLDLRYMPISPKTSIANEFYYIVTVPFEGIIKAVANICTRPLGGEYKSIKNFTHVKILADDYCKSYEHSRESKVGSTLNVIEFANLINTTYKSKFYEFNYDKFIYNITVILSNNMSISVNNNGFLTIYLENNEDREIYEDFKWIIQGVRFKDFPAKFRGYVKPKSRTEIYRAHLPIIFNKPGKFKTIIISSKKLIFNVSLTSPKEILKVKELVSKITPILEIEYNSSKPQICRVSLPKYSLYIKVEVRLDPEKLKQFQVLYKPWFVDVEVVRSINAILRMINDSKVRKIFIEKWGNKNVTVIIIYINNTSDKSLNITDWGGYDIVIYNMHGEPLGGYSLKVDVLKPYRITVKPGQKKLYTFLILEYINDVLFINGGYCCEELKLGKYILRIAFQTRPYISIDAVIELKQH